MRLFCWMAKWFGTLSCLFLIVVTAMTMYWKYVNVTDHAFLLVGAGQGSFGIVLGEVTPYNRFRDDAIEFGGVYASWTELRESWASNAAWTPRIDRYPGGVSMLIVPAWIPLLLLGVPTIWLWCRQPRPISDESCEECGYDLTGNVSGRCLECGASVPMTEPIAGAPESHPRD